MTQPVSRAVVESFYRALSARDMDVVAGSLADDVVWTISGPVDILPFCGKRVGKALVLVMLNRDSPALLATRRFTAEAILVDGDRAAVRGRLTANKRGSGHPINYRIAHFIRFRDEKVVEYVSILDSFDAVEQVLGHSLVPDSHAGLGNVVAL